jgi:hypothetical protein
MDFNLMSVIDPYELQSELFRWSPRAFIFTDVACGKLHLNWKCYGLQRADLGDYWSLAWQQILTGYSLVSWEKAHHTASSALWVDSTELSPQETV